MKKGKIIAAVTGITATVAALGGCVFDVCANENQCVYGAPLPEYTNDSEYNPAENDEQKVYGPPLSDS